MLLKDSSKTKNNQELVKASIDALVKALEGDSCRWSSAGPSRAFLAAIPENSSISVTNHK
jgi:hypothetical protein